MVNVRLAARGIRQKLKMPTVATGAKPQPRTIRKVGFGSAKGYEDSPV